MKDCITRMSEDYKELKRLAVQTIAALDKLLDEQCPGNKGRQGAANDLRQG